MMKSVPLCLLGALLLVQAVSAEPRARATAVTPAGLLRNKFPCTQPDPPIATFAWAAYSASSFQDDNGVNLSCKDACGKFHLRNVNELPTGEFDEPFVSLCRFFYTNDDGGVSTAYGTEITPGSCESNVTEADPGSRYDCGCCGTINRVGKPYNTGCDQVTVFVVNTAACPAGTVWTNAGTQICRAPSEVDGEPDLFGTISDGECLIPDTGAADPGWEKLCYKINAYSGPPAPDCKRKTTGK